MAEIPVEKKSNAKWLWILLLLLLGALLLWWLLAEDNDADFENADPVAVEESADLSSVNANSQMTLSAILANPSNYYGMEGYTGEVTIDGPLTDRGFWIENDGARMFAIVVDEPAERRIDINPGATLRLSGGTIREPSTISATDIEGDTLDQDTLDAITGEEAVLVIDEANMEIIEAA